MTAPVSPTNRESVRPTVSYQDLLDRDSRPENVPAVLRLVNWSPIGDVHVPVERYVSRQFHEEEKAKLWSRVWQMACREEDIPDVGDHLVYDICDWSILLVRSTPHEIRAFYNACLHRGRQLRDRDGHSDELRCPFHGFCWNLDGSLKQVPCEWDFPDLEFAEFGLPEVKVGRWGGFVFINMDPQAESLDTFLGDLPSHFEKWPLDRRHKAVHVAKIFPANWKVVQEAFMEAFHVVATHPQLLAGIGDANSQYDWWGNFSRAITANGTPSPHLSWEPTEQDMFDAMSDRRLDQPPFVEIRPGMTARGASGDGGRIRLGAALGEAADQLSDAEVTDSIYYTLFPNLHPWGAYNRIVYRFRPYQDEHERSIMECMLLEPYDGAKRKPRAVPIHWLSEDEPWTDAPELGLLARVFTQDSFNLPKVQRGLHSIQRPNIRLAAYQETKIRHFHSLLGRWLSSGSSAANT
jgi:phenylpropionate dioxygenase-like ring-hydroxylating dioxygenase large terminal subunit